MGETAFVPALGTPATHSTVPGLDAQLYHGSPWEAAGMAEAWGSCHVCRLVPAIMGLCGGNQQRNAVSADMPVFVSLPLLLK